MRMGLPSAPGRNERGEADSQRAITTGAIALALAAGAAVAVPTAANAADQTWVSDGHVTESDCLFAEGMARGVIAGGGGEIYAGDVCAYRGLTSQWGFSLTHR